MNKHMKHPVQVIGLGSVAVSVYVAIFCLAKSVAFSL